MNRIVRALYDFTLKQDQSFSYGDCTEEDRAQFERLIAAGGAREPMQPFEMDTERDTEGRGRVRFRANAVVRRLLDQSSARSRAPFGLSELASVDNELRFRQADWEEFYQLIGYSLFGYHELSCISDDAALLATKAAQKAFPDDPKVIGCRDQGCKIHLGVPSVADYKDAQEQYDTERREEGARAERLRIAAYVRSFAGNPTADPGELADEIESGRYKDP